MNPLPCPGNPAQPVNTANLPNPVEHPEPPQTTASVPVVMTRAMKVKLAKLGYTPEQMSNMRPAEAVEITKPGTRAPSLVAHDRVIIDVTREAKAVLEKLRRSKKAREAAKRFSWSETAVFARRDG